MIDNGKGGYRWRLVRRTPSGADVLARGVGGYPDEASCRRALAALARIPGDAALVIQQPDGNWHWRASGPDGRPLAESPAVYRDAARCGQALADLRRTLAGLPALARPDAPGAPGDPGDPVRSPAATPVP